jgi:uncharacterized protein Yka (UPF0111/DUF47 family)
MGERLTAKQMKAIVDTAKVLEEQRKVNTIENWVDTILQTIEKDAHSGEIQRWFGFDTYDSVIPHIHEISDELRKLGYVVQHDIESILVRWA